MGLEPKSYDAIYRRAIEQWGYVPQMLMACEECSELSQALLHFIRGRKTDVIDEIADVMIMCHQVRMIFGEDKVDARIAAKMLRLEQRLDAGAVSNTGSGHEALRD